jgi:uncharacterized protein (DUF2267 family)
MVHKADVWVNEVMHETGAYDRHGALRALRAGLHALRDRLTLAETVQLAAQLPTIVRGIYFESWTPAHQPVRIRSKQEFLALVERELQPNDPDPETVARAVFLLLRHHVSAGEIANVRDILPGPIEALWEPEALA